MTKLDGLPDLRDPEIREARVERLRNYGQFGHAGRHHGSGAPACPRELHHHHDAFCIQPTPAEVAMSGRTDYKFDPKERA